MYQRVFRHRRSFLSRGAAMVESIIVCSLLALFMSCGLFVHRLYFGKIQALDQARAAGWTQALGGCNDGVDLGAVWSAEGGDSSDIDIDTESAPSFFGSLSHTKGSAKVSVAALGGAPDGAYDLSLTTSVACNEIPADKRGDVNSIVGYASSTLVPSFF